MRRRITYLQPPSSPFHQNQASLTPDSLTITNLDAAKEDRVTFRLEDIPAEISDVLHESHELHIRWTSERREDRDWPAPWSSRVSSGLHVFFTPAFPERTSDGLCPLLTKVFGFGGDTGRGECLLPQISFTTPPTTSSPRFSTASSSFQYHTLLPSPDALVAYIQASICGGPETDKECHDQADSLRTAESIDVDYDAISRALTVSGFWSAPLPVSSGIGKREGGERGWTEKIPAGKGDKMEVGILGVEGKATNVEEIKVGGLLGVVGEDQKLKPTLFSFPSRHHPLPDDAGYTVSFPAPAGLHPTMAISMPRASLRRPPAPEDATCALHTYLTLPSTIFGDKYQLSTQDPLFLQSHNLVALHAVSGETDLEAPDWFVPQWGSNWLLELATPESASEQNLAEAQDTDWNVTIPLHLRYLRPSESGYRTAEVPWPIVFWACTVDEGTKMGVNPFDRVNLGWDGLFGPGTMFYQFHPQLARGDSSSARLVEELDVPVLQLKDDAIFNGRAIELGTVAVILLGSLWVLWKLGLVVRSGTGAQRRAKQGKTE